MKGQPSILVDHSQFITENMDRQRVSADDIFSEMHKSGPERLGQVKWAILETDGRISFIPYQTTMFQVGSRREEMVE